MDEITVGGLCSGTGVLEHVVAEQVGGRVAWHAQHEPPDKNGREDRWQFASRILAHHWPDIPNLGDITAVDWTAVERVDWVTAGFPCQDVSLAGKREGLVEGTRSGIWRHVAACIAAQRAMRRRGEPGPYIYIENVKGLRSAQADSDVEPCPECLGDEPAEPPLRALAGVLADLAGLGFDAEWLSLRAAEVGAAHERERVFILAWPAADAGVPGLQGPGCAQERDTATAERRPAPADSANDGLARHRNSRDRRNGSADGSPLASDPDRSERSGQQGEQPRGSAPAGSGGSDINWGPYGRAIRRQEEAFDRRAPRPTQPGRSGDQLAPRFSEWLMGIPEGHVTSVPKPEDMTAAGYRNAQLKALEAIDAGRPYRTVLLEQVPTVLPVWEAFAAILRAEGYSVVTGRLSAEEYGVPQTRVRAFLAASLVRDAQLPMPTHHRYRKEAARQEALWLRPWVSMADAIGWGMTARPALTIAVGTAAGGPDPSCVGGSGARATLYGERDAGRWINCPRIVEAGDLPAYRGGRRDTIRLSVQDAAILQSFPADYPWRGSRTKQLEQIGNAVPPLLAMHVVAAASGLDLPAHLVQEAAA